MLGAMLWFNDSKDFGFLSTDEGERVYVDGSGFAAGERPEGRCKGLAVSFQLTGTGSSRRAEEVVFVEKEAPRRARRRRSTRGAGVG
ncbi:MAG: cold shock domain-containing protein [Actinomycetota bacterium]|nr:cold shock domain-containing protein [Actinomycetota bacterium]